MLIEILNWVEIIDVVAKKTNRTKLSLCREIGIEGNAMANLTGSNKLPELRHSEGEYLLGLFKSATFGRVPPVAKKTTEVKCPSCMRTNKREDMMRIDGNHIRCLTCIDRARKLSIEKRKNAR